MRTDAELETAADNITQAFYDSEKVATKIIEAIGDEDPLTVVFAALLIDRIFTKRVEDWVPIRDFAQSSWQTMDSQGALPKIGDY